MERLIKNILGQWKIISTEELNKAWVKDIKDSSPAKNLPGLYGRKLEAPPVSPTVDPKVEDFKKNQKANKPILDSMFDRMNLHIKSGKKEFAQRAAGDIHQYVTGSEPGHIDLGHLNNLISKQERNSDADINPPVTPMNLQEFVEHHLKHEPDLKNVHDLHGGEGAVKAVMQAHRSAMRSGDNTDLNLHPDLINDLKELSGNASLGGYETDKKQTNKSKYSNTIEDRELDRQSKRHHYNAHDDDGNVVSLSSLDKHHNTAIESGLDRFKRFHKIK
jgi:hypothetical protein